MATTDVMKGEDIGGLTRRHFLKMSGVAAGVATMGIAAVALLANNNTPLPENQAAIVQTEEKSEAYKAIASKYTNQIEAGKKYVAEKHGVSLGQVNPIILAKIGPRENCGARSSVPENSIYGVYKHPEGYFSLTLIPNKEPHEESDFLYCNNTAREVARKFLRTFGTTEVGIVSLRRIHDEEYKWVKHTSDEMYKVTLTRGYGDLGMMCDVEGILHETYAFDADNEVITGRFNFQIIEEGTCITEKEESRQFAPPDGKIELLPH